MRALFICLLAAAACGYPKPADVGDDGGSHGSDAAGSDAAGSDATGSDASPDTMLPDGPCACQLLALTPSIAATGDTIALEGTFGATATVHFAGNIDAAATVLGPHHATLVVPAGVASGPVTVTTGGITTVALPFRHTFPPVLGDFAADYPQATGAHTMPAAAGRQAYATVRVDQYVYLIGGGGPASVDGSIARARINADGTMAPPTSVGLSTLSRPRYGHEAVVLGGWLYVLGGRDGSGVMGAVERAAINADGTFGAFANVNNVSLQTPRSDFAAVIVGDYLYVIGGRGAVVLGSVERAPIAPDGTLGPFSTVSGVALLTARSNLTAAVIGNILYVFGGTSSGPLASVEAATIEGSGDLDAFQAAGTSLQTARGHHAMTVIGKTIYLFGGFDGTSALASVEAATIGAAGDLGAFSTLPSALTVGRQDFRVAVAGNQVYALADGTTGRFETAPLTPTTGSFGAWTTNASALTSARPGAGAVVLGRYVYIVGGGTTPVTTVERAPVDEDGNVGAFAVVPGVTLNTPRAHAVYAVIDNYLYAMGGFDGTSYLSSIERAPIETDGTLDSFVALGATLASIRSGATAAVIDSYFYVVGGRTASTPVASVERTQIVSGTLGAMSSYAGSTLAAARYGHTTLVRGQNLHVLGGYGTAGPLNSIESAAWTSTALGAFARISPTMTHARYNACSISSAAAAFVIAGSESSGPVQTIDYEPGQGSDSIGLFNELAMTLQHTHDGGACFVLGGQIVVFGGDTPSVESTPLP